MRLALLAMLVASACQHPPPPPAPAAVRCERGAPCPWGYTCRYQQSDAGLTGVCRVEVGRCNSDLDCAPVAQQCQRFGPTPGTCVNR